MYSSHFYTHTVHSSQVMFPFLRVEYLLYVSYLKFCMELVSSLLFITLFNHLFISIQTHECLFCNSRQNSLLLFFFFVLFQFLQIGTLGTFSVSSCALLKQHHHFFLSFFCTAECSMLSFYVFIALIVKVSIRLPSQLSW